MRFFSTFNLEYLEFETENAEIFCIERLETFKTLLLQVAHKQAAELMLVGLWSKNVF